LCHDDLLPKNSVDSLVSAMKKNPRVLFATGGEEFIDSQRKKRDWRSLGDQHCVSGRKLRSKLIRRGNLVGGPSSIFLNRAKFLQRPFNENLVCSFDYEYWIYLSRLSALAISDEVVTCSRVHLKQATSKCQTGGFESDNVHILLETLKYGTVLDRLLVLFKLMHTKLI
jgi:hypothetical protein